MAKLKGVVFGIRDVLVKEGKFDVAILAEIGRLVSFLKSKGVASVAIGNRDWSVVEGSSGKRMDLKETLEKEWDVPFQWFIYGTDGFPPKQSSAALERIRSEMGWEANEMLYVGNSDDDMRSALNGGTLFLNALWYGDNNEYGFRFKTPKDVARFIDIFCLREHWWYFKIEDGDLRVYALAPYSTYKVEAYKNHSENFIKTVKHKLGDEEDVDFWAKYLCTSTYFSGLYESISYIAPYPGHGKGAAAPSILEEPLNAFAKCFRGRYLPNLIIRHTAAIESKKNRTTVDHLNQLNTIKLNNKPNKNETESYANTPLKVGKTVMVVDDLLTNGYSFEAARAFIQASQAKVVCVGFLKSLNSDYKAIKKLQFDIPEGPYKAYKFSKVSEAKTYGYSEHVVDRDAAQELSTKLDNYRDWDWPA